jgi:hypothetical protein
MEMRSLQETEADLLALEQEGEGLLKKMIGEEIEQ